MHGVIDELFFQQTENEAIISIFTASLIAGGVLWWLGRTFVGVILSWVPVGFVFIVGLMLTIEVHYLVTESPVEIRKPINVVSWYLYELFDMRYITGMFARVPKDYQSLVIVFLGLLLTGTICLPFVASANLLYLTWQKQQQIKRERIAESAESAKDSLKSESRTEKTGILYSEADGG